MATPQNKKLTNQKRKPKKQTDIMRTAHSNLYEV
jgi:hypothetical protein